jgi:hypothetical protein
MDVVWFVEGIPIRLTEERWVHIVENHDDLAGYYDDVLEVVEQPDLIVRSYGNALIAVRSYGHRRYLAVIYRQVSKEDGFIITAYFTDKVDRKKAIWKKQ